MKPRASVRRRVRSRWSRSVLQEWRKHAAAENSSSARRRGRRGPRSWREDRRRGAAESARPRAGRIPTMDLTRWAKASFALAQTENPGTTAHMSALSWASGRQGRPR